MARVRTPVPDDALVALAAYTRSTDLSRQDGSPAPARRAEPQGGRADPHGRARERRLAGGGHRARHRFAGRRLRLARAAVAPRARRGVAAHLDVKEALEVGDARVRVGRVDEVAVAEDGRVRHASALALFGERRRAGRAPHGLAVDVAAQVGLGAAAALAAERALALTIRRRGRPGALRVAARRAAGLALPRTRRLIGRGRACARAGALARGAAVALAVEGARVGRAFVRTTPLAAGLAHRQRRRTPARAAGLELSVARDLQVRRRARDVAGAAHVGRARLVAVEDGAPAVGRDV